MNYVPYFTDIEDEFIRQRGHGLMLSAIDWELIESWQQRGVPLHVVLRAMAEVMEGAKSRGQRVSSLRYCEHAVDEGYREWRQGQVGKSADAGQTAAEPNRLQLAIDAVDFAMEIEGVSFSEAIERLRTDAKFATSPSDPVDFVSVVVYYFRDQRGLKLEAAA